MPGVLADPMMDLYSGSTVIGSNDNWGSASNAAAITATGLVPGPYTIIVRGVGNASGVGIVEVLAQ